MAAGGSAVDTAEAAVNVLENDPTFYARYGSVLTADQGIEMDAIVMDGRTLNAGTVAGVTSVRNAVSLAKAVKDETSHTLIVGAGADKIARKFGIEEVGVQQLVTKAAQDEWDLFAASGAGAYGNTVDSLFTSQLAPALLLVQILIQMQMQRIPNLANTQRAASASTATETSLRLTSTGGITFKVPGRVGDSPIIGAGCYAQ